MTAHEESTNEIEQLKAKIEELSSDTAIRAREAAAVDLWRADGGKIDLGDDDAHSEQHARVLASLQNDVMRLERELEDVQEQRNQLRSDRDDLQLELTELRATHKRRQIKHERDAAAAIEVKEQTIASLESLARQQAEDNDRLRTELREITLLMEEKEGIEDLERQLNSQVGEHASIDEVRAVLASVQMARECERLNHLKELDKLQVLHRRIAVELAESRDIDKHQHEMEQRADEIAALIQEAKDIKAGRRKPSHHATWADAGSAMESSLTASTPTHAAPTAKGRRGGPHKTLATRRPGTTPTTAISTATTYTHAKKKKRSKGSKGKATRKIGGHTSGSIAKSKARTELILMGIKPSAASPRAPGGISRTPDLGGLGVGREYDGLQSRSEYAYDPQTTRRSAEWAADAFRSDEDTSLGGVGGPDAYGVGDGSDNLDSVNGQDALTSAFDFGAGEDDDVGSVGDGLAAWDLTTTDTRRASVPTEY
eukprot:m.92745 g.92745  ORF g.92745 m.92745 type:complete len:484 (-) comp9972_c0_seq1:142-1593(-)